MATSNLHLLLIAFSLLAVSATARPCKTLFFVTSTSYYSIPTTVSENPNPNFSLYNPTFSPRLLTLFFTTTTTTTESRVIDDEWNFDRIRIGLEKELVEEYEDKKSSSLMLIPGEFYSSVTRSFRGRTNDNLGALLFGVGCGALAAAAMYLIWSLCWPARFDFEDSDDDFEDGADEASLKKLGYVAFPATKVVDHDDLKKFTQPAKEVV